MLLNSHLSSFSTLLLADLVCVERDLVVPDLELPCSLSCSFFCPSRSEPFRPGLASVCCLTVDFCVSAVGGWGDLLFVGLDCLVSLLALEGDSTEPALKFV